MMNGVGSLIESETIDCTKVTRKPKMSQSELNFEQQLKLEEASIQKLPLQVELAKMELEMKKLEQETMRMQHEENSRVRDHELQMAKLKIEENKAQYEIEKQRFEERQLVTKEFQEKFDEMNAKISAMQAELKQAKQNGVVDIKSVALAISGIAMLFGKYFGYIGTAAASEMAACAADIGLTPIVKEVLIKS